MKRIYFAILLFVFTLPYSVAQWGSAIEQSLLLYSGNISDSEMAVAPNGATWVYYQVSEDENFNGRVVCVQLLDTLGNKVFGEHGLLVSDYPNRSWNLCNDYLFVDRDGNAIITVHDTRNAVEKQFLSYTIYKISQDGEFLWGKDGLSLEGTQAFATSSHMTMTQIDDGSYVLAWGTVDEATDQWSVKMQRISPEGEMLWNLDEVTLSDPTGKTTYTWPTVIDAGLNQVIVVYFAGSSLDMMARKLDFDGTPVWSEDTKLYRGGWTSVPAWSLIDVKPSGDGGVIVAWNDDRHLTGSRTYMTYVQTNGEIGFAAGIDGQKLGYSEYLGTQASCMYDPHTDTFLALWRESYSAVYYRIVAQRLTKDGEPLWGEEGYELHPFSTNQYAYGSIQTAPDRQAAFFYMHNNLKDLNTENFVTLLNTADTTQRKDFMFSPMDVFCEKFELASSALTPQNSWTVMWQEGYSGSVVDIKMHRINTDLTLGSKNASVDAVEVEDFTFSAVADMVQGNTLFAVNATQATQAVLTIYDLNGAVVATPFDGVLNVGKQYLEWNANVPAGVYLATLTTHNGVKTVKILVK
ncbi:MAG: T9SS type A sorting domain-containing protein [Bacteroidales bacterium]|nr:T9SS type A sorting domain-containing protein [Bacteroidales bacterium]